MSVIGECKQMIDSTHANLKSNTKYIIRQNLDGLTRNLAEIIETAIQEHHNGFSPHQNNFNPKFNKYRSYVANIMSKLVPQGYCWKMEYDGQRDWYVITIAPRKSSSCPIQ